MTNMGEDSALITIASSRNTGRPRNEVALEQIHGHRQALGLVRQRLKTESENKMEGIILSLYCIGCSKWKNNFLCKLP